MNFTIVHKSSGGGEGKMFINIMKFHGVVEEFIGDVTRETFAKTKQSNRDITVHQNFNSISLVPSAHLFPSANINK
jgi:hypothetical protein